MKFSAIVFCRLNLVICLSIFSTALAQNSPASINESRKAIPTYDFSDPSPIPILESRKDIYPYFRFDGYAHEKQDKDWTVVEMENDYVRLAVLPEVGGKVWGAIEKSSGQEFLYWNKVLKFRDIAMRGPWTSGGLEFNFGFIGHTPTTATPVDYLVRTNADGSVSCFLGAMDMNSRTQWRVEVRLPKDQAAFETYYRWYNPTPMHQAYYYWSNSAIRASDDLQFFYPGDHYIGHGGELSEWPINPEGRDLSLYRNNNFGPSKSYHILNHNRNYKSAYWHDREFGMGHWSPHGDLPGQKLWVWALSRSGGIWEDLLTDTDGQYVEVQAGRMLNQASLSSGYDSPFGQFALAPYQNDTWQGAWFPVLQTKGISDASRQGVLHSWQSKDSLYIRFMALRGTDTELKVFNGPDLLHTLPIQLTPTQTWQKSLPLPQQREALRITVADLSKDWVAPTLQRPLARKTDVTETAAAQFFAGEQEFMYRKYEAAKPAYEACLAIDPFYQRAWLRLAEIAYQQGHAEEALEKLAKVLEIDTYDGGANYLLGVIMMDQSRPTAAREAWNLAVKSPAYQVPAWVRMAESYFAAGEISWARFYAKKALRFDSEQIPALQVLALCARMDRDDDAAVPRERLLEIDPLCHFSRAESWLEMDNVLTKSEFTGLIRNEFPHETYLELAIYYHRMGRDQDATRILELSPPYPMIYYWLGYLNPKKAAESYAKATALSPALVYPSRLESLPVLEAAAKVDNSWKSQYYQGLILWSRNRLEEAKAAFNACGETPDFGPFYQTRAILGQEMGGPEAMILSDLKRAVKLADDGDWRAAYRLSRYELQTGHFAEGLATVEKLYAAHPDQFVVGMYYAKALLYHDRFEDCLEVLEKVQVLPFEGAGEGKVVYLQANVLEAMRRMQLGKYKQALKYLAAAREWPENLGVGQPYEPDERLIDWLEAYCRNKTGETQKAGQLYEAIADYTLSRRERPDATHYLGVRALDMLGRKSEADLLLEKRYEQSSPQWEWVVDRRNNPAAAATFEAEYKQAMSVRIPHDSFELLLRALEFQNQ